MNGGRLCEKCKGLCLAIACSSNVPASEHYCPKCHISYPMGKERAEQILDGEFAAMRAARGRKK